MIALGVRAPGGPSVVVDNKVTILLHLALGSILPICVAGPGWAATAVVQHEVAITLHHHAARPIGSIIALVNLQITDQDALITICCAAARVGGPDGFALEVVDHQVPVVLHVQPCHIGTVCVRGPDRRIVVIDHQVTICLHLALRPVLTICVGGPSGTVAAVVHNKVSIPLHRHIVSSTIATSCPVFVVGKQFIVGVVSMRADNGMGRHVDDTWKKYARWSRSNEIF